MSDDKMQPRPRLFDIILVVIGPTMLAAGFGMFKGSPWLAVLGFMAGCALGAATWRWPKVAGPGLLILSIPGMLYGLAITLYTLGMPQALVSLWGSAALFAGALGVLRQGAAPGQPIRYFVIGSLAVVFLLYFVILWPPQGKAILVSLPIIKQTVSPQVQAETGGIWAAYWTTEPMTIPEALESVKRSVESDGWTIVDSSTSGHGFPLISAQRGAYSLEVIYEPAPPGSYWPTGAYMAAYVRRAQARQFDEPDPNR